MTAMPASQLRCSCARTPWHAHRSIVAAAAKQRRRRPCGYYLHAAARARGSLPCRAPFACCLVPVEFRQLHSGTCMGRGVAMPRGVDTLGIGTCIFCCCCLLPRGTALGHVGVWQTHYNTHTAGHSFDFALCALRVATSEAVSSVAQRLKRGRNALVHVIVSAAKLPCRLMPLAAFQRRLGSHVAIIMPPFARFR